MDSAQAAAAVSSIDQLTSQVVIAGLVSYTLERVKRAAWFPWLTMQSKKANAIVAAVIAGAVALGVHFEYDAAAGTLLVTGLTVDALRHGIWEYAKQYVIQQGWYDAVIQPSSQGKG